jgi:protein-arginine kinase activator protein McsA
MFCSPKCCKKRQNIKLAKILNNTKNNSALGTFCAESRNHFTEIRYDKVIKVIESYVKSLLIKKIVKTRRWKKLCHF